MSCLFHKKVFLKTPKQFIVRSFIVLFSFLSSFVGWGQTVFGYNSNSDPTQYYNVPAGVSRVFVKLWGAGGGGGSDNACGGGGAYVEGVLQVTPGEQLTIIVGQGGWNNNSNNAFNPFGGGGSAGNDRAGHGGGRSAIRRGGTEVVTAGGGGGGGRYSNSCSQRAGGAGGINNGLPGNVSSGTPAGGGTQNSGGTAGVGPGSNTATNGGFLIGGRGDNCNGRGGGGGGGYFGGGGGGCNGNGGGGGSSYISNLCASNGSAAGSGRNSGNTSGGNTYGQGANGTNGGTGGDNTFFNNSSRRAQGNPGRIEITPYTENAGIISVTADACVGNSNITITNVQPASNSAGFNPSYTFYYRGGPSNINWTVFPGMPTSSPTATLPAIVYNTSGVWYIARNVNFGCGEFNSASTLDLPITINSTSTAGTTSSPQGTIVDVGTTVTINRSGGSPTALWYVADHTNNFMGWDVCNGCQNTNSYTNTFNESGTYLIRPYGTNAACGTNFSECCGNDFWLTVRPRTRVESVQAYSIICNPGSTTLTANAHVDINRGLVAHLQFNGDLSDASGNNNIASFPSSASSQPTYTADRFGNFARALNFDGNNDFLTIPTLTNLSGDQLTVAYWFKGSNNQSAIRQQVGGNYLVSGWSTGLHILSNDGNTNNGMNQGSNVRDGNWHHVVMTWQRDLSSVYTWQPSSVFMFRAYVDGALVSTRTSFNSPIPNINAATYIGSIDGTGEFTNGILDDIRIYRKALTANEVAQISGVGQSFNYSWSPTSGLNSSTSQSVVASPTSTTTYTVTTSFNSGPAGSSQSIITVLSPASINFTGGGSVCEANTNSNLSVAGDNISDLLAYYPFSNSFNDASGNNLDLSGSGGTINSGGLSLNRTSSYQSPVTSILSNNNNHTFTFYIRFDSEPNGQWSKIFGYEPAGTDRSPGIWMFPTTGVRIHWRYGENSFAPSVWPQGNTGINEEAGYTIGQWYHVAGVKDGSTFSLFINGALAYSGAIANPIWSGSSALKFGGAPVTLKEFRIYNRVLNLNDINATRQWNWLSGASCSGPSIGSGNSINVSPTTTTSYSVQDPNTTSYCFSCPGSTTITVNSPPSIISISPP
jgi:hypothetical protein